MTPEQHEAIIAKVNEMRDESARDLDRAWAHEEIVWDDHDMLVPA